MEEYVKNVRQFVVGQGLVQECPPRGKLPPPPPQLDRILGEKVSHLSLQNPAAAKPVAQFITAKPFVKTESTTQQVRRMSAKPDASAAIVQEEFDLPPPPPELLAPSPDNNTKRPSDPVRDFFDFLDEQEGKKLPGKLKSPFLHQAAASGTFNATARPFGTSPGTSPNLSQRSATKPPPLGSSPLLDKRQSGQPTNQRRLMTTDFDYVPEDPVTKANNNNPAAVAPSINNNNLSPSANRRPSGQQQQQPTYQQEVIQQSEQQWCCRKCSQPIEAGTVAIFAERAGSDKCWHPQCFVCSICNASFSR